jgi:hypothetical protein
MQALFIKSCLYWALEGSVVELVSHEYNIIKEEHHFWEIG